MKISEVPKKAMSEPPTPIPTKTVVVYDWDALLAIVNKKGFIVIESEDVRAMTNGAEECVQVKAFNSHLRQTKGIPLRTKRISKNRWYCTL